MPKNYEKKFTIQEIKFSVTEDFITVNNSLIYSPVCKYLVQK